MIEKLLDASIRFRWGVVILTLIISAYGLSELMKLPIDAVLRTPGIKGATDRPVAPD
ncbi:hypothetical protein [Novosphingobium sp.]|uniref:hypothetical protein n=1 Tax=Novosphingobium sp. TaxID=1874826 RepID=UPI001DD8A8F4|nr:hypothetical protein [Novosphingobium sp.]MBX9663563.1 hypothetical protein [Novosphingobium sp.]